MPSSTTRPARKAYRGNRGASQLAEFAPTLYILFILVLMPLLDLASAFVAGAVQYLATNDFAAKAATQANFATALNSMAHEANQFQSNGLAQFVHLSPIGGYTGCGDDMYVLSTDLGSKAVTTSNADEPLSMPINTQNNMYELSVRSTYRVMPLVSLAEVPVLGDIPGLGKPMVFVFNANRPIEHPGGLQWSDVADDTNNNGGGVVPFPNVASNSATAPVTNITWRTPNIYELIKQAGETVIDQEVLIVQANNPNWTPTYLNVQAGDKVWIDYRANGSWSVGQAASEYTTANGMNQNNSDGLPIGSMIGKMSNPGTMFFLGQQKWNFPPPGSGQLSLAMNDSTYGPATPAAPSDYSNNMGCMIVRVIVAR